MKFSFKIDITVDSPLTEFLAQLDPKVQLLLTAEYLKLMSAHQFEGNPEKIRTQALANIQKLISEAGTKKVS